MPGTTPGELTVNEVYKGQCVDLLNVALGKSSGDGYTPCCNPGDCGTQLFHMGFTENCVSKAME